jgi:predicted dehydrogenase
MAIPIRVGVVGASVTEGRSGWGSGAHVPALKALPGYQLKAVCTSQESTAKASAEKFGAELGFHRIEDMISRDDIDLVSVVVRVPQHHALVMKALAAGKAVYCEWPLGNGLKEGEEMAAREKNGCGHHDRPSVAQRPHGSLCKRAGGAGLPGRGAVRQPESGAGITARARQWPHLAG